MARQDIQLPDMDMMVKASLSVVDVQEGLREILFTLHMRQHNGAFSDPPLIEHGVPLAVGVVLVTSNPAQALHLPHKGHVEVDMGAVLLIVDEKKRYNIQTTYSRKLTN